MTPDSLKIYSLISDNPELLSRLESFISDHKGDDPIGLRLKLIDGSTPAEERAFINFALIQLEARRKFSSKLRHPDSIIFPSMLAGEQSSNIHVSEFHGDIVAGSESLLDLTAGLGIDFISMASAMGKGGENCVAVEIDPEKHACLSVNLHKQGLDKAETICGDAIEVLKQFKAQGRRFDVIFIDPARRDDNGGRVYDPSDCQPDVVSNMDLLFEVADRVIIKNSPMVDVTKAMKLFPDTVRMYLVSVRNECKELLVDMCRTDLPSKISTVDILSNGERQVTELDTTDTGEVYEEKIMDESTLKDWLSNGDVWLYEPSSTQMKLAAWNVLAKKYDMVKSSPNSHIFFSRTYHEDFPGRILIIERILDKKAVRDLKGEPRNVVTRNYPLKAVPLTKKLRVNTCDDKFVYGLTISPDEKPMLLDTKLY